MCDGYVDCPSGEDEYNCVNISCPGLMKCRNENRCIGPEQMCDGNNDCIYSNDDEMMCNKCPVGCRCEEYTIQCDYINVNMYRQLRANHAKSLILKGKITTLSLDKITCINLVSSDLSFCNIQYVGSEIISKIQFPFLNVLHANLSNNYIKINTFLLDNQTCYFRLNPLSPHDTLRHHFTSLKNKDFRMKSSMKQVYRYMAIFLLFSNHIKSSSSTTSRELR